jgi:hypothetical protein
MLIHSRVSGSVFAVILFQCTSALMLLPSASAADELSEFSERLTLNILGGQPEFGERIDRMIREKLTAFRLEQMAAGINSRELDQRLKEKYEELTRSREAFHSEAVKDSSKFLFNDEMVTVQAGMKFTVILEASATIEESLRKSPWEKDLKAIYQPTTIFFPMVARLIPSLKETAGNINDWRNGLMRHLTSETRGSAAAGSIPFDDTLRQVFWKRALDVTEAAQKICRAVFVLWRVRGKAALAKFDGASVSYRERYQARSGADIKSVEVMIADNRGFSTEGQPNRWNPKSVPNVTILQFTPQDLFKVQQGLRELNNPTFSPTTEELRLLNRLWTLADLFQQRLKQIPQELLELARRGNTPGVYHLRLFTKAFYWMPVNWEGTYQKVLIPSTGEAPSREVRNLSKKSYIDRLTGNQGVFIRLPISPAYALIGKQDLDLGNAAEKRFQNTLKLQAMRGDNEIKRSDDGFTIQGPWRRLAWGVARVEFGVSEFAQNGKHRYRIGWGINPAELNIETSPGTPRTVP